MNIEIQGVRVDVGGTKLFEVPKFDLAEGEHLLITGASGAGKTTFLHLVAGLLRPDAGRVTLGRQPLGDLGDDARARFRRRHVGLVFQRLNLIDHLTALENAWLPANDPARAREALTSLGLAAKLDVPAARLSLGEQQRVAVARVLAGDHALILADEPTSSLDAPNARAVIDALVAAAHGKTLIVVSHDQRVERAFKTTRAFTELTR